MTFTHCIQCGKELPPPAKTGPRRKFCPGGECSRRYHNDQHAARAGRDPETIKRRKPRATLPASDTCLHCGVSIKHTRRRRFCCDDHAELWTNAQRNIGIQKDYHWLSEIDEERRTATCSRCGSESPIYSGGTKLKADGSRTWWCRNAVNAEKRLAARYESEWRKRGIDLTYARFLEMLEEQGGLCAICLDELPSDRKATVDHCHATNRVRGLLCSECNLGLGKLGDTVERLEAALAYLRAAA